jgi:hypothetical protein
VGVELRVVTAEDWFKQHSQQVGSTEGHLWGPHIRKEAVTLFIGEKSVGKTTLLYNLCYKLSNGEPFLDIHPPRPLRILHFDYEVDDQTRVDTMFNVGHRAKNWIFPARDEDGGDINGAELFHRLETMVPGEFDMVIADPLCDAYPVKNENDNEEANVQMRRFRKLARSKRVAVVLIHNTGRPPFNPKGGEQSAVERATKKHMGRGATARADRADIVLNYVAVDKTVRMLCVAGSRTPGHLGHTWTLDFDGNHGLAVRNVQSQSQSHESHTQNETGIGIETLTGLLQEHTGKDLQTIYEQYVKPKMTRSSFYRRVQQIRMPKGTPSVSGESASATAPGSAPSLPSA